MRIVEQWNLLDRSTLRRQPLRIDQVVAVMALADAAWREGAEIDPHDFRFEPHMCIYAVDGADGFSACGGMYYDVWHPHATELVQEIEAIASVD